MKINSVLKILAISILLYHNCLFAQTKKATYSFIAKNMEWKGMAVQDKNYSLWGCAPIQDDKGKTHLFVARWPEKNVDPAWRKSSEIAHYVADHPEGSLFFQMLLSKEPVQIPGTNMHLIIRKSKK